MFTQSCIPLSKVGKISKDDIWLSLKITFSYPQNPLAEGEVAMLELCTCFFLPPWVLEII
jgi:hypothetical protein